MDRLRKYILLFLHLISAITYVKCDGQIAILEKPSSLKLYGGNEIRSSEFLSSIEDLLGYPSPSEGPKKMEMMNVFQLGGMKLCMILLDDKEFADYSSRAPKKYQMKEDMLPEDIRSILTKHFVGKNSFGMNVYLDDFKNTEFVDMNSENPRVFWIDGRSMSEPEITKTLADLTKITSGSSNVLKVILSSDGKRSGSYDREKRQTPPVPTDDSNGSKKEPVTAKTLNLADDYDENFPVIFNIMLWFSIALIFALISICMVIANMDPGRDSIIYRMTSTRMKKDN